MDIDRKSDTRTEFAKFGFVEASQRIEGLHAKFVRHEFATHVHDTWAVGAVLSGAKDISPKREPRRVVTDGDCYALPPHRPHAGRSVSDHCEYVMLYVPDQEWREQCAAYGVDPEKFLNSVSSRPQFARQLASFVGLVLRYPEMVAKWTGEWAVFCEAIFSPPGCTEFAQARVASACGSRDFRIVRARDYLREFWDKNVSLAELAREASMSTYELCRRFSATYGLTPHRYQLVLRLTSAKSQLLQGASISEVATDTGFSDQSHLGRHFKSVFGVTPGTVVREAARSREK
ncbi:helix-turn-helix domain-containing protein [Paraburkholderia mimosarum]|uniref:AraC family transcriptional regulator n=1 Tax=Paraburkholderia mimosarum TaxID=312026 RepID=UPI0039C3B706